VRLPTGEQFDIIALTRDTRIVRADSGGRRVVVSLNYYAKATTPTDRAHEAETVLAVARAAADSIDAAEIEIRQTFPIGWRWTGLVHGVVWKFSRRADGAWQRE
jgi:hypothetical protein